MIVKMSLSPAVQNMVLSQLNTAFGISESYPQRHVITCRPDHFCRFMAEVSKLPQKPSIDQLNIEYLDPKAEPMRTNVRCRP